MDVTPSKFLRSFGDVSNKVLRSLADWNNFAEQVDRAEVSAPVVIAFVGKYNKGGGDAYQSVLAALHHSAVAMRRKLKIDWIDATDLERPGKLEDVGEEARVSQRMME